MASSFLSGLSSPMGSKTKRKPRPKGRKRLVTNFKSTTAYSNNDKTGAGDDFLNSNSIIDESNLVALMYKTICIGCRQLWQGKVRCRKREGLHEYLEFTCDYCERTIQLPTSKQETGSQRHVINIRAQLGAHLAGIGRNGLLKICAALNIPPPVDEQHYATTDNYLINAVQAHQQTSINLGVQAAVREAGSSNLTVSDDGSWITRGRTSAHSIAELCSTTAKPKVIDIERSSKNCSQCLGAESIRLSNPDKYELFMESHRCDINYSGASGSMERTLIHQLFQRSVSKYQIQYHYYIGDGDAKVHNSLLNDPPYKDVVVKKIEDVNHYAKRLYNRCKKLKDDSKKQDPERRFEDRWCWSFD
jgi:hypothetical protein